MDAARQRLGGELVNDGATFWSQVREHELPAFAGPLWRLSVKPTAAPPSLPGTQVVEWNGSLRWLSSDAPADQIFEAALAAGGHATRFRGASGEEIMRLPASLLGLHKRIKVALDPQGVFGPRRLHAGF